MYLLDTNIIMELLLDQEKSNEVEQFMRETRLDNLYLSEFSLYSLGIVLLRRGMYDVFLQTVDDLLVAGGVRLLRVGVRDMQDVVVAARRFNLDFDDAYQYVISEKYGLTIVSFDSDFDHTDLGRKTPGKVMSG